MPRRVRVTTTQSRSGHGEPDEDDDRAIDGIANARRELDVAAEPRRQRRIYGRAAPEHRDQLVEEEDQPEGGEHLIEVVALVQRAQRDELGDDADGQRGGQREQDGEQEAAGVRVKGRGEVGAHHVEGAVGEVDEVHDAEHERQPRGHEEEHHAELEAVQRLLENEEHRQPRARTAAVEKERGAVTTAPLIGTLSTAATTSSRSPAQ